MMQFSDLETATLKCDIDLVKKAMLQGPLIDDINESICISAENGSSSILIYFIKCCDNKEINSRNIHWRDVTAASVDASQQESLNILMEYDYLSLEKGNYYKMGYQTQSLSVLKWCYTLWYGLRFYQDAHMWQQHCIALTSKHTLDVQEQIRILLWLKDINCCTDMYLPLYIVAESGDFGLFKQLLSIPNRKFPVDVTTYNIAKNHGHINIMNDIKHSFLHK